MGSFSFWHWLLLVALMASYGLPVLLCLCVIFIARKKLARRA